MSEWIACNERLPEYDIETPCLVCTPYEAYILDWMPESQEFRFGNTVITHWMPLPGPPGAEK